MNQDEVERLLGAYETDVRFPDVSGMEHLDMLLTRTRIEKQKDSLSPEQRERLAVADQMLVEQSDHFYAAIMEVADLDAWRRKQGAQASHWWWYLDVLAHAWTRFNASAQRAPTSG